MPTLVVIQIDPPGPCTQVGPLSMNHASTAPVDMKQPLLESEALPLSTMATDAETLACCLTAETLLSGPVSEF